MVHTFVDSVIEELDCLEKLGFYSDVGDQALTLKVELQFLRTFLWGSLKWTNSSINGGNVEAAMAEAGKQLLVARERFVLDEFKEDLDHLILDLLRRVEEFKMEIGESSMFWTKCLLRPNCPMSGKDLLEFIESVLENLKDLMNLKGNLIVSLKGKILALEEKLRFLRKFIIFTVGQHIVYWRLGDFLTHNGAVVGNAAIFTYFCWLRKMDESKEDVNDSLSDMFEKIKPNKPELVEMYIGILKASAISQTDIDLAGEVVISFVNFLLENLLVPVSDQTEAILEGLILIMGFLTHPPDQYSWHAKLVSSHAETVIGQTASLVWSFCHDSRIDCITIERDHVLSDILKNIEIFKKMVKEMIPAISYLPSSFLPAPNNAGSIDSFLSSLRKIMECKSDSVTFVRHQLEIILRELESLKPFLTNTSAQQTDPEELKCFWPSITGVVKEAEYIINSFLVGHCPVWYYLSQLSDTISLCKSIKAKAFCYEHNDHPTAQKSTRTSNTALPQVDSSPVDEVVVGFHDEKEIIREQLTRGTMRLDIVAIVGMPGLGKTTLARKLYNEPLVAYHFHVRAWCCISQAYEKRVLVLTILSQVIELTDQICSKNDEDLDELLRKCLKGRRYLIIMDDMWNTDAWNDLKNSFPDDKKGSRIMFTTRLREVALQAKPDCSPHSLRLFSIEESWELLEKKLFQQEQCPKELLDLGRQIAAGCKGLPLSIVLVAGLLARTEKKQYWWKQVAESLSSKLVGEMEQCMEILDLSYKNLSDHLKACFLYFGSFPEDEEVVAQKLTRLWVAEGLVCDNELKSLEDVAEGYLMDLINRSLVMISKRSSKGGVKTCQVHDLLHEFCKAKAKEEYFLELIYDDDIKEPTLSDMITQFEGHVLDDSVIYEVRWLSVFAKWERFRNNMPSGPRVRSLMFFSAYNTNQFLNRSSFGPLVSDIFYKFKLLWVLDFGRIHVGDSFPSKIVKLVHLKYLSLCGRIDFIPSSIANLGNLETLIVQGLKGEVVLPDTIWKMATLRNLHINNRFVFREDNSDSWKTSVSNLETCSTLSLSHGMQNILKRLVNVRRLKCIFFESYCFSDLELLSQLESLKLLYYGQTILPSAFSLPSSLRKLTLSKFCLPWDKISTIGKLPNLEVLKLLHRAFEGPQWDMIDGEFLKLKFLKLDGLNFVQWNASCDHFPLLQQLVLHRCKQLQEIPSSLGDIPTLEKIEVQWCGVSASNSAREIQTEQQDMGNDFLKVLIHPFHEDSSSIS